MIDFKPDTIKTVAYELMGEPNTQLSSAADIRYGAHGSLSIDPAKNTFYDHEQNAGGGILDLICREADTDKAGAIAWLKERGLVEDTGQPKVKPTLVKTYDYRTADGELQFQVLRYEPKTFRQRRPDGNGWAWSVKGIEQVPYRLPELLAQADATVYVVEGEKDADNMAQIGLVATCNAGGAGKWHNTHAKHLKGRHVVILPDQDKAGRDHAQKVAKTLDGIAEIVSILELPGLPGKGDVTDWLNAGGTAEQLMELTQTMAVKPESEEDAEEEIKRSQTDRLVEYAQAHFDLLHDKNGDVFTRESQSGELRRLGGLQFKDRLISGFYEKFKLAVRDQALREALGTLQAIGRYNGEAKDISTRVAKHGQAYYIDLCEPGNSRAIEVNPGSWRIVDTPPVLFVRGDAMQPLPTPVHGGKLGLLWHTANIPENDRVMVVTWLVESLRADTPYPGLELIGEQGSGKSTGAEAVRRVIDPSSCNLRGAPKTVEDVFVCAKQNHVVAYENISHLAGPMQDALAILSTGGGYSKRKLYSDDDESIINVRRPWLINGISISVTQQDLVDRVISIECPVIETRQSSSRQWENFEADLPQILGGLLDVAAKALEILPSMSLPPADRPRLVEYVLLGMAVAKSAGKNPDSFLTRFKELRAETVGRTLDASPVASAIMEFVEASPQGITAPVKDILHRLEHHKPVGAEFWPRSPKGLGDALRRAAPALRQMGVECKSIGKMHGGTINWLIRKKTPESKSPKSSMSPESAEDADFVDQSGDMGTSRTLSQPISLEEIQPATEFEL